MPTEEGRRELRDYLAVLRRRRWVIIAATILVTGTALVMSLIQTPVYKARARVLIRPPAALFSPNAGQTAAEVSVDTQIQVIRSEPVQTAAKERLGGITPAVSAIPVGQTSVVEISAESTSAVQAARLANTYTEAYLEYSRQQNVDDLAAAGAQIQKQIDDLQGRINDLAERLNALPACTGNNPPSECAQRPSLQQDRDALVVQLVPLRQKLDQLQVDSSFNRGGPTILTPAAVPTDPVRPAPKRNGVLGFAVGLFFGIALAFAFEHFDDSIKSKEDLERSAKDLPVFGVIPFVPSWRNREETRLISQSEPSSPAAEAYRTLRTSIHFLGIDRTLRTIQITSPNASEGKTTAVANLAVTLARAGERVVVVSCDLRRPRIHEFFGLPNTVGFTSVLLGEAPLSAVLQTVPDEERVSLLASGPLPPNPSELLASERTADLMVALRARATIVLLDCPPVLPVTDAAVLSARADGVLLVATVGSTSRKQIARSVELLNQVGAPLLGTILNGVTAEGAYGYAYKYYTADPTTNGRHAGKRTKQSTRP